MCIQHHHHLNSLCKLVLLGHCQWANFIANVLLNHYLMAISTEEYISIKLFPNISLKLCEQNKKNIFATKLVHSSAYV